MKSIIRLTTLSPPPTTTPNPPTLEPLFPLSHPHSLKFPLNSQPPIKRLFIVHPPSPPSNINNNNNNNNNNNGDNNSNDGENGGGGGGGKWVGWSSWILWLVRRWFNRALDCGTEVESTGWVRWTSVEFCINTIVISLTLTVAILGLIVAALIVNLVSFFWKF